MCTLAAYVCIPCVSSVVEEVLDPLELVLRMVVGRHVDAVYRNSSSLQEQ